LIDRPAEPDSAVEDSSSLFERWIGGREVAHLGSNGGAAPLAFQRWHHFKEAFPPELIQRMFEEDEREVGSCLDVFGGSGTTALASQLLDVDSTTIEVNPFLVDVIRAKVSRYDVDELERDLAGVLRRAAKADVDPRGFFAEVPATFIQPGLGERWVFDLLVARQLAAVLSAISEVRSEKHRRLFKILIGGMLAEVSNVVINGKGRRYRRNWEERRRKPEEVMTTFAERAENAIADLRDFEGRPRVRAAVRKGDARKAKPGRKHDLAIISPPYPNSFDYTDIYNLELWMLGYLSGSKANRSLRRATLSSHVQLQREFGDPPPGSPLLAETLADLEAKRDELWNPWIPAMVGGYFADMMQVLANIHAGLHEDRRCCIVVGDSRYREVQVPAAKILAELAERNGWSVRSAEPVRAMRSSAQHGGTLDLDETLLILGSLPAP
jgi:DNA methylase